MPSTKQEAIQFASVLLSFLSTMGLLLLMFVLNGIKDDIAEMKADVATIRRDLTNHLVNHPDHELRQQIVTLRGEIRLLEDKVARSGKAP